MSLSHEQIARAFSAHRFHEVYPFLTDETLWAMVGGTLHHGRESIVRACDAATVYLRTQRTTFTKFEVLCGPDFAVVDSMAAYVDGDNLRSTVASCDIYRFREQSVREIVSFTVELPPA